MDRLWMGGWIDKRRDRWIMDVRMDGFTLGKMDDGCKDEWMNVGTDG